MRFQNAEILLEHSRC